MPKVTQLVRIKAGVISEQETNSTLKGLVEEGSMKDFFKELEAPLRELTMGKEATQSVMGSTVSPKLIC